MRERIDATRLPILAWIDGQSEFLRTALRNVRFVLQVRDIRGRWERPDYKLALVHLADIDARPGDVPREIRQTLRAMLDKARMT